MAKLNAELTADIELTLIEKVKPLVELLAQARVQEIDVNVTLLHTNGQKTILTSKIVV